MKRTGYMDAYQKRIVENPERNAAIAEIVKEGRRRGYHVILLLERLRHLKLVSQRLKDVKHRIVAGTKYRGETMVWNKKKQKLMRKVIGEKIEVKTRRKIQKRFEKSKVRVILANKVFKKGVDIKRVDVIIDGAALQNKDDALQKFGRGVRLHAKKKGLLYFDMSDQDDINKKNWFAKAARSRKRAFKQAGIKMKDYDWNVGDVEELYDTAERFLKRELRKGG